MEMSEVIYTKKERQLVKQGIGAVREVLMGGSTAQKRSLLLCLDWYLDPYYGQDISGMREELIELLQTVVVSPNETAVREDALELLQSYVLEPLGPQQRFLVLEQNFEAIPSALQRQVEWLIRMDRESEEHQKILLAGPCAMREILLGGDAGRKQRLLFCLEWDLEPEDGKKPPAVEGELAELLETVAVSPNETAVRSDALEVLENYGKGPFAILEQGLVQLEPPLQERAKELICKCKKPQKQEP